MKENGFVDGGIVSFSVFIVGLVFVFLLGMFVLIASAFALPELCSNSLYSTEYAGDFSKEVGLTPESRKSLARAINEEGDSALWNISDLDCLQSFNLNLSWYQNNVYQSISDYNPSKIRDISALRFLINLSGLDLSKTSVSDLAPLKNMKNLRWLSLNGDKTSDFLPLMELKELGRLSIENPNLSNLSVLYRLRNLKYLELYGSFSNEECQEIINNFKKTRRVNSEDTYYKYNAKFNTNECSIAFS